MTSRSLRPDSVHGRQAEARRNDLVVLEAARDVFSALGADAPVSAVADRAGVGIGTLYRRFGSKTELLQRLCVLAMDQTLQAADDALEASDPWAGLGRVAQRGTRRAGRADRDHGAAARRRPAEHDAPGRDRGPRPP